MKYLVLLFFLEIINLIFSQNQITGNIVDSLGPISYVKVYNKQGEFATLSDLKGYFEIQCKLNDTLYFESNGFENKDLIINNFDKLTIVLEPKINELQDVIVSLYKIQKTILKFQKESKLKYHSQVLPPFYENAVYVQNMNQNRGIIKNVSIYIPFACNLSAPFRINLYEINLSTGLPGKSLINKDIIIKPKNQMEWLTINLDTLKISLPKFGFFCSVEALPFDGVFYANLDSLKTINPEKLLNHEPLTLGVGGCNKTDKELYYCMRINKNISNSSENYHWIKLQNSKSNHFGMKTELIIFSTSEKLEENMTSTAFNFESIVSPNEMKKRLNVQLKLNTKLYPQSSIKEVLESMIKSLESDNWRYCFVYLMANSFSKEELNSFCDDLLNNENQGFDLLIQRKKITTVLKNVLKKIDVLEVKKTSNNVYKLCDDNDVGLEFINLNNSWFMYDFFITNDSQ